MPRLHRRPRRAARSSSAIEFIVEARYPHQIWEIEVPLRGRPLRRRGRRARSWSTTSTRPTSEIFEISDPGSEIELVTWRARVRCRLRERGAGRARGRRAGGVEIGGTRRVYFAGAGWVEATVCAVRGDRRREAR